jgi:putative ABC transport system permease protein
MKRGLFGRLAVQGILRNRRATLPYMLSCTGIVMMAFLMQVLAGTDSLTEMYGARTLRRTLEFGTVIIQIFAVITLFYTHSFVVKQRTKEFGVFYVLGLEKKHIARIMAWETILIMLVTTALGIGLGVVFSKLMYLILLRLLGTGLMPQLHLPTGAFVQTICLFGVIHMLTLLNSVRQVATSRPVDMLRSGNVGEKDPPARVWLAIIGTICLLGGYALSLTTHDMTSAAYRFFLAVLLVILGTYALFLAGSVSILKGLRRNKRFYYHPRHFHVVAGLIHRMKRNATGLASICILSTMVLVMISATASMFIGKEGALRRQLGREAVFTLIHTQDEMQENLAIQTIRDMATEQGIPVNDPITYRTQEVWAVYNADMTRSYPLGDSSLYPDDFEPAFNVQFTLADAEDFTRLTGRTRVLASGEALAVPVSAQDFELPDTFPLFGLNVHVVEWLDSAWPVQHFTTYGSLRMLLVMPQEDTRALHRAFYADVPELPNQPVRDTYRFNYAFDTGDMDTETVYAFTQAVQSRIANAFQAAYPDRPVALSMDHLTLTKADFNAVYGGLLFVAVFLGLVFIMAMVLIIYYKQVSEGYEDQQRFAILRQVGMSDQEIRRSIRSQVVLVFLLPLAVAGLHTLMAFNIVRYVLYIMSLQDTHLYAWTSIGTFLVFAVFYLLVYMKTAQSYYKIVRPGVS